MSRDDRIAGARSIVKEKFARRGGAAVGTNIGDIRVASGGSAVENDLGAIAGCCAAIVGVHTGPRSRAVVHELNQSADRRAGRTANVSEGAAAGVSAVDEVHRGSGGDGARVA